MSERELEALVRVGASGRCAACAYLPSSKGTPLDDQGVLIVNGYAIGFALGGPGALVALQNAWLPDPYINYGWAPFVVHPGETKYVMYFATVRSAASAVDAATQTQALVNLTDPDALTDLSAAEKAGIVNFAILH